MGCSCVQLLEHSLHFTLTCSDYVRCHLGDSHRHADSRSCCSWCTYYLYRMTHHKNREFKHQDSGELRQQ